MKREKRIPLVALTTFILASCGLGSGPFADLGEGGFVPNDPSEEVTLIKTENPLSAYEAPEQGDVTQFYQKRAWPVLTRGMTFYVEDYVGMVAGKNDEGGDTNFRTYVVDAEDDAVVGYVSGGDGVTNNIILYRPGQLVFNVYANGQIGTFEVTVQENTEFNALMDALEPYGRNYTAYQYGYDEDGKEVEDTTIYASSHYIYDEAAGGGYVLSKKDDQCYSFTLTDAENADLVPYKVPTGTKVDYNSDTVSFSILQTTGAWSYSPNFANNPSYSKFKFRFFYSYAMACRLYSNLGMTASSYNIGGTTMYPYFMYASYADGQLELLPVMVSGDLVYISIIRPFRLSNPGTTSVKALDDYVAAYSAPEKVDVSEIVDALTYVSTNLNYTLTSEIEITDPDGDVLPANSNYYTSHDYFYMLGRHPGVRSITKEAYHGTQFHGSSYDSYVPGGYWSKDGVTYDYTQDLQTKEYYTTREAIEYGETKPYAHWYNYSILQYYIPTAVMSMNNVRNSYPEYDAETKTYTMNTDLTASINVMKGVVIMGYHWDVMQQMTGVFYLSMINDGTLAWNFDYDEDGIVSEITMTLEFDLTGEVFDGIAADAPFHYKNVIKIGNIGTTDLSAVTSQLKPFVEEENA